MSKHLWGIFAAAGVVLLASCAASFIEYDRADAGRVVIGIGAAKGTDYAYYELMYRQKAVELREDVNQPRLAYYQHFDMFKQVRDYDAAEENGVVVSFRMKPGTYEVFAHRVGGRRGDLSLGTHSVNEYSIPFTITKGETTYLGNFQANRIWIDNGNGKPFDSAMFVISDRQQADLDWIRKRSPAIDFGAVRNATPKGSSIASPLFVDEDQMHRNKKTKPETRNGRAVQVLASRECEPGLNEAGSREDAGNSKYPLVPSGGSRWFLASKCLRTMDIAQGFTASLD